MQLIQINHDDCEQAGVFQTYVAEIVEDLVVQ